MSAPAGTYQDGEFLWDSQIITIGSKDFIAEDFSPVEGSTTDVTNNVNATPRGARHRRTLMQFGGTLQYPAGATMADTPALFTEFQAKHRGADKWFVITEVGTPMKPGQEIKVAVKIAELINHTT